MKKKLVPGRMFTAGELEKRNKVMREHAKSGQLQIAFDTATKNLEKDNVGICLLFILDALNELTKRISTLETPKSPICGVDGKPLKRGK